MEQQYAFNGACKYVADSVDRCRQMAQFIKKRQAIEDEYAKSLRKLCKSISLAPFQEEKSSWFFSRAKKADPSEGGAHEDVSKTSLWGTFYEIMDDTSQVAKSHAAYAESLQHQLLDPLTTSIKEMETTQRQVIGEGRALELKIREAAARLKKVRKQFEDCGAETAACRANLEQMQSQHQLGKAVEIEKQAGKTRSAEERYASTRQSFRMQEEAYRTMQGRFYSHELPHIMKQLHQQEQNRSRDSLGYMLGLIELERRCAVMNDSFASEMIGKLKGIDLSRDDQRYIMAFLSTPLAVPVISTPTAMVMNSAPLASASAVIRPQTPSYMAMHAHSHHQPSPQQHATPHATLPLSTSMPPSYESQNGAKSIDSLPGLTALYHDTGSAVLLSYDNSQEHHSRQATIEGPSHP